MNVDSINRLKKSFPNCYPREVQIDMDKFEDEFARWPTDPEPQLDRREEFEDRFRDQFSDFDDVKPKEGEDLKESEDSLKDISKRLRETLDAGDYPGSPHDGFSEADVSPEVMAFYLPFHYFSPKIWGIYLIAEGVMFLRDCLLLTTGNSFTRSEAERLAKAFLFYHESYHNKVEIFSTKMEISVRKPFYTSGQLALSRAPCHKDWFHEESLANYFAVQSASDYFRKNIRMSNSIKDKKEAINALEEWIDTCTSSPYKDSLNIKNRNHQKQIEMHFQEQVHYESLIPNKKQSHQVWQTFNNALRGDLPRGAKCSYITPRNSLIVRRTKLGRTLFKTKKLKSFLEKRYKDVSFQKSKVHQSTIVLNGRKSDLPLCSDIDRHTAGKIIRDLDLLDANGNKFNYTTLRQAVINI